MFLSERAHGRVSKLFDSVGSEALVYKWERIKTKVANNEPIENPELEVFLIYKWLATKQILDDVTE